MTKSGCIHHISRQERTGESSRSDVKSATVSVFQQPAVRSLLAEASPDDLRGRVQGVAGLAGAIGGAGSAFWSLPLYHQNHAAPFVIAGMVMAVGSLISTVSAVSLAHRAVPVVCRDVVAHSADA